jgi:hypothetical protein
MTARLAPAGVAPATAGVMVEDGRLPMRSVPSALEACTCWYPGYCYYSLLDFVPESEFLPMMCSHVRHIAFMFRRLRSCRIVANIFYKAHYLAKHLDLCARSEADPMHPNFRPVSPAMTQVYHIATFGSECKHGKTAHLVLCCRGGFCAVL